MRRLSELEHVVLGIVWRDGPCTAYAIRREFANSPSSHWGGSAGSIYPLVERLVEAGMLRAQAGGTEKRPAQLYRVSRSGKATLRAWLTPPLPDEAVTAEFDPVRTRLFFLGALLPEQRHLLLNDAETRLHHWTDTARQHRRELERKGDVFGALAARGVERVARAKLAWVREVREAIAANTTTVEP